MDHAKNYGPFALAAALVIFGFVTTNPVSQLFAWIGGALAVCAGAIFYSTRLGTAATALLAASANAYLLWDKVAASDKPPLCSVNEIVNCRAVNASEYSELFGVPVTLLGVAFYVALMALALAGRDLAPKLHQVNGLFMIFALAFSAYLGDASARLGLVCPFCISIYVANVLLMWAAVRGLAETEGRLFQDLGSVPASTSFVGISAIFLLILGVGGFATRGAGGSTEPIANAADPSAAVAKLFAKVNGVVKLDGHEARLGNANARYTVVEYADFGCGHCAHAFPKLHKLIDDNPDVQLLFKNYPLSGECNPSLEPGRPGVCLAAIAAECAHQQGKFYEYSDLVFTNQSALQMTPAEFEFLAQDAGLDLDTWRVCAEDPKTLEFILADALHGNEAGVRGTPALFLKGTHGEEWVSITHTPDDLGRLIEAHRDGVSMPEPKAHSEELH